MKKTLSFLQFLNRHLSTNVRRCDVVGVFLVTPARRPRRFEGRRLRDVRRHVGVPCQLLFQLESLGPLVLQLLPKVGHLLGVDLDLLSLELEQVPESRHR